MLTILHFFKKNWHPLDNHTFLFWGVEHLPTTLLVFETLWINLPLQIQRKVISNVFKYFKKSDQPIYFLLHQILLDFYPQCLAKPRSKYGNVFCTCLKTQGLGTQRKTLNKHLKSRIGYLRVVILHPSSNSDIMIHSKLHYFLMWKSSHCHVLGVDKLFGEGTTCKHCHCWTFNIYILPCHFMDLMPSRKKKMQTPMITLHTKKM
jgi:hypothetical protein